MSCNEKQEGCQKPESLTGKPQNCTPDQVRKCHGDVKEHPCTSKPAKQGAREHG